MSHFSHICGSYLRFIWRELLCFWIVSILASIWAWRDPAEIPDIALSALEAVTWLWLTVRLMLAEPTFLAQGGWQVRPVNAMVWPMARWSLYLAALLVPMLIRNSCLNWTLGWTLGEWWHWNAWPALLLLLTLAIAALAIEVLGKSARGGDIKRWLMGAASILLGLVLAAFGAAFNPANAGQARGGGGGSGFSSVPPGMTAVIPTGDSCIGRRNAGGRTPSELGLRVAARVPLEQDSSTLANDINFKIVTLRQKRYRLELGVEVDGPRRAFQGWDEGLVLGVRYANGMWGYQVSYGRRWSSVALAGFPYMHREEGGEILSPLIQPWVTDSWQDLMNGAELYVLVPDASVPAPTVTEKEQMPVSIGRSETTVDLPKLSPNPTQKELDAVVRATVDQWQIRWANEVETKELNQAGAAAVPTVLACAPFSHYAWETVSWFLQHHVTEAHLPKLRQMLVDEPRMADIFLAKGWDEAALPILRQHLKNRVLLNERSLLALAKLKDESLADDLAAQIFIGPRSDTTEIGRALRNHPGIDWLKLVRNVCTKALSEGKEIGYAWLEAAAPLGDKEVFRQQAAKWLYNTMSGPNIPTIHQWIAPEAWNGDPKQFQDWLRTNFEKLRWDDAMKRWVL